MCRDRQQSSPTGIQAEHSQLLDRNLVETALTKSLDFASLDELDPSLGGMPGRLFWTGQPFHMSVDWLSTMRSCSMANRHIVLTL